MNTVAELRPYLLTDVEAETLFVLVGAAIEHVASTATDDQLIAALALRDRFKPQQEDQ